jgi:hypothetical protein
MPFLLSHFFPGDKIENCEMLLLYWGAALGIVDHLRRGFARFKLGVYLLQSRSQRFNLLLQPLDSPFLFLVLAVFFEELVDQHSVHRFVANGVWLTVAVGNHQVRIHSRYFFGHQSKPRGIRLYGKIS